MKGKKQLKVIHEWVKYWKDNAEPLYAFDENDYLVEVNEKR